MKRSLLIVALICCACTLSAQSKKQAKGEQFRLDSIAGAEAREYVQQRMWFLNADKMNALRANPTSAVNSVLQQNYTPELATAVSCFIQAENSGLLQTDYFVRNKDEYYYIEEGEYRGSIINEKYKSDKKGRVFYTFDLVVNPNMTLPCALRMEPNTNVAEMTFEFTAYEFKLELKGVVVKYEPPAE